MNSYLFKDPFELIDKEWFHDCQVNAAICELLVADGVSRHPNDPGPVGEILDSSGRLEPIDAHAHMDVHKYHLGQVSLRLLDGLFPRRCPQIVVLGAKGHGQYLNQRILVYKVVVHHQDGNFRKVC
jgi:hypothetical protein